MTSQYKIYNTLCKRLLRNGFSKTGHNKKFPNRGSIATYLCDLYLKFDGIVSMSDLVNYGIIKEGETKEFLAALVKYHYIIWDMDINVKNKIHRYQTYCAVNLADLINKEKGVEFATKQEMQCIRVEINELRGCIKKLIERFDPPFTDEKYKDYIKWSKD